MSPAGYCENAGIAHVQVSCVCALPEGCDNHISRNCPPGKGVMHRAVQVIAANLTVHILRHCISQVGENVSCSCRLMRQALQGQAPLSADRRQGPENRILGCQKASGVFVMVGIQLDNTTHSEQLNPNLDEVSG